MKPKNLIALLLVALAAYLAMHGGGILPGNSPFGGTGLRVLIVEETEARSTISAGQRDQILGTATGSVRDYCATHCVKVGELPEFRVLDQNDDVSKESAIWQDVMKRERKSVPWLVVGNGKSGFEGPLPDTADATLVILKRYGG